MKNIILVMALVFSTTLFGQDPILQKDAPQLQKKAFDITEKYNAQLALDGKQVILFEKKVEEFLIRREKIEKELKGRDKLNALFNLQTQETLEMNNILTRPQLDLYKQIKQEIQPLATVDN
ncbi:hypothetical protein SAMN03097699_0998 [Flavobacteriaceae bacterium MAR_2010_188]|nr:hypothetical protein SAMN03097699_0998 [Flavobacteriaceae bacterium MAR_2010_188]